MYRTFGKLDHTYPNIHTAKQRQNMTKRVTHTYNINTHTVKQTPSTTQQGYTWTVKEQHAVTCRLHTQAYMTYQITQTHVYRCDNSTTESKTHCKRVTSPKYIFI